MRVLHPSRLLAAWPGVGSIGTESGRFPVCGSQDTGGGLPANRTGRDRSPKPALGGTLGAPAGGGDRDGIESSSPRICSGPAPRPMRSTRSVASGDHFPRVPRHARADGESRRVTALSHRFRGRAGRPRLRHNPQRSSSAHASEEAQCGLRDGACRERPRAMRTRTGVHTPLMSMTAGDLGCSKPALRRPDPHQAGRHGP